jgi:transcriptional antiterminator RfaH
MQTATTSASDRRWYVVQCKPRQDVRALENLARQGFECYLPRLSVERLRNGRKVVAQESLFPGYLFIHLHAGKDNWAPIRSTRGVSQMVRVGDQPLPVGNEIVDLIRQRLAAQAPRPYFQYGDRVRIADGCFSHLDAIFIVNDAQDRVMLLLNILHHEHLLSFPIASVRKNASIFNTSG